MKQLMFLVLALVAGLAFAKEVKDGQEVKVRGTPEQRMYGGFVTQPNSAKGKVVFLNAQKLLPFKEIQPALDEIARVIHPEMGVVEVESVKLINPREDIVKAGGKVGVVLADSPDLPMMVTAPENGWAIVNVAALKDGKPDGFARRVRIELMRAFALASGCAFMSRDPIVLTPHILISEDLDTVVGEGYGCFAVTQMEQELLTHGVTPWRIVPYDTACREGWAHSPTNRFEERIWKKVHGVPKNPTTIEFDPKKGR